MDDHKKAFIILPKAFQNGAKKKLDLDVSFTLKDRNKGVLAGQIPVHTKYSDTRTTSMNVELCLYCSFEQVFSN